MISTIVLLAYVFSFLAALILLWGLFLRMGLRWAKVSGVTMRRVAFAMLLVFVSGIGLKIISYSVSQTVPELSLISEIARYVTMVFVLCFIIMEVFKASFFQAFRAWLPTLLSPIICLTFATLVIHPFIIETFMLPTNPMAPTLLGERWQGTCVECGNPAFGSPIPRQNASSDTPWMICRDNFHVTQPTDHDDKVFGSEASSPLKKSGSGPIFGETACFLRKSLTENLDLTPSFHFFNGL